MQRREVRGHDGFEQVEFRRDRLVGCVELVDETSRDVKIVHAAQQILRLSQITHQVPIDRHAGRPRDFERVAELLHRDAHAMQPVRHIRRGRQIDGFAQRRGSLRELGRQGDAPVRPETQSRKTTSLRQPRKRPQLDVVEDLDQASRRAGSIAIDIPSNGADGGCRGRKARADADKELLHDIQIANPTEGPAQVPAELDLIRIGFVEHLQGCPNSAQRDPCLVNAFHICVADARPVLAHELQIVEGKFAWRCCGGHQLVRMQPLHHEHVTYVTNARAGGTLCPVARARE